MHTSRDSEMPKRTTSSQLTTDTHHMPKGLIRGTKFTPLRRSPAGDFGISLDFKGEIMMAGRCP